MKQENITINLGDEYDKKLQESLRSVLIANEAIGISEDWGIAGSQELETIIVRFGEVAIKIESETYIGITIEGPKNVVESLAEKIWKYKSEI